MFGNKITGAPSKFAASLLSVYSANALNGVLGVVAVPIGLRSLGPEGYGLFSLYLLMISYVLLADLGVSKHLLRLLSCSRDSRDGVDYLRTALALYYGLSAAWFGLLPLLLWLVPAILFPVEPRYCAQLRWLTVIAVTEFAVGIPQSLIQTSALAKERFGDYSRFTLLSGVLRNSVIILGALVFGSPCGLAAAMLARKAVDFCLAARILGGLPKAAWRPRFSRRDAAMMLAQSGTLSVAQVLYSSLMSVGSYLMNAHFGLYWLGIYRVAFDLAGKISFLSNGVGLVLFPKLAYAFRNEARRKSIALLLGPALDVSWLFYCALGAVAVMAAPHALPKIGVANPDAIGLFVLIVIGLSLNCHGLVTNEIIQASGHYRRNIVVTVSGLVIMIAVFSLSRWKAGPASIGVGWIAAAVSIGVIADTVALRSLDIRWPFCAASGALKAVACGLCGLTLASYYHIAGGEIGLFGVIALVGLLLRKALRLRTIGFGGAPSPVMATGGDAVTSLS